MIVLVSLIVLLRGYPCFHDFFAWCIPTSIFNDFSHIFQGRVYINAATRMRTYMRSAAPLSRVV